jgi:hypothetical protein
VRLQLGCTVRCTDDPDVGELADVVVDPATRHVTHLVVQPHHRPELGRLVPAARARQDADAGLEISIGARDLESYETVRRTDYLTLGDRPAGSEDRDVGIESIHVAPSELVAGGLDGAPLDDDPHAFVTYDQVPKGEVELCRTSTITSSDGHLVGYVDAVLLRHDGRITHVVARHGHLWRRREVAIPEGAIEALRSDTVALAVLDRDVGHLASAGPHLRGT